MFTEYNNLPETSRVWVYQSDREFTAAEVQYISEKATEFVNTWTHHGDRLKGSFTIKYNQFLILAADESFNAVSGCSIDDSIRFIRELQTELNVDLLDKMNVSFKDGAHINIVKLAQFQQFAKEKKITPETIVFNNIIATKDEVTTKWEIPAKESWHKRFLV